MVCPLISHIVDLVYSDLPSLLRTKLLHVGQPPEVSPKPKEEPIPLFDESSPSIPPIVEPHPDERQVRLDTDRSFVLYPVGEPFPSASV